MAEERDEVASDAVRALKSDIDHTRAQIAATVDAIEDRLRPRRLVAEAGDTIKEAVARPLQTARLHPAVGVAIVVLALGVVAGLVRRSARQARAGDDTQRWPREMNSPPPPDTAWAFSANP